VSDDPATTDAASDEQAIEAFRAGAEAMGLDTDDSDDLVEKARDAAASGRISLAEALAQESAELAVHLGREG
jgi:hypothetical protein